SHRMDSDIPLLIPNVNPDHLQLTKYQKTLRKWKGIIVTSPNCTATILTVAIAPIYRNFGISQLYVSSMQAISGAGYPGVPSLDIMGNIIPYIEKEEEKVQTEPLKILGTPHNSGIKQASFSIQATCNRVPVHHGHTISVFIELPTRVAITEIKKTLITSFSTEKNGFRLISLSEEPDRPQPLKDVMKGNGMTVTIGRLRETQKGLSFTCLGHNLILGAAGAAIANAKRVIQYLNR
ncbi:MAG: aspartate-semialdehyde dehydrogenase, partial [Promethearchaeota archaeon]